MKRWRWLALPMVIGFGTAAGAQTTSNCTTTFNGWTCRTQPQAGVNWGLINNGPNVGASVMNGFEAGRREAEERRRNELIRQQLDIQAAQQRAQAEQSQSTSPELADRLLREEVGKRLAAGDCEGAEKLALYSGNVSLATDARAYCKATSQ